ncbi:MAG: OmpH family outer membrane protein [Candidatus Kapaibacterium sp.]
MRNTALLLMLLCGAGLSAAQGETNIGVIDSEQIIQAMPEYTQGEQKLTALTKAYQDTLNAMNGGLQRDLKAYQENLGTMTADVKAKTEERLRNIQQQMQQYQQAKEQEIQQRRAALLAPIREKILAAVNAVATEMKLDAIVDKKTGGMVFVSKRIDITFKVLDKIQRG